VARKYRKRTIPTHYATGAEERAAADAKGERFFIDADGEPMHRVIRDRITGDIVERCYSGSTEAHERVAEWNKAGGRPSDRGGSWSKLQRTIPEGSAAWWIERVCGDPETGPELQRHGSLGTLLTLADIKQLLARTTAHRPHLDLLENPKLIDHVSTELARRYGIGRAEEGRIAAAQQRWADKT
jgi:hypothetical protein